jgi:glycerate 2-kinase
LSKFKKIYVVGGGKAGAGMAQAIEEILGNRISAGFVIVPYGSKQQTQIIQINEAKHPIPDETGLAGAKNILKTAQETTEDDLLICLISGGGSSLMPLPLHGLTLQDKQTLTESLLRSGATINEINVIRKHLSSFKGGWLAKKAYPATVLNLILSDVVGDSLETIASGPTVGDPSTFADAKKVLEKYDLWLNAPASARQMIMDGVEGKLEETPKPNDPVFEKVHNIIVGNNKTATEAAAEYLKSQGLKTVRFDEPLEGEAKQVGKALANFASKVSSFSFSLPKPLAVVAGGETTVKVAGKGVGGRNQEMALSAALGLSDADNCVIASLCTDGVDGPTDAAGAVVDSETSRHGTRLGLNIAAFLIENDSYHFFAELGDLIMTGPTGTNVNDISVIVAL